MRQSGEHLISIQIPGDGGTEDVVSCLLYVNGYVWCGSNNGTINVFNCNVCSASARVFVHRDSDSDSRTTDRQTGERARRRRRRRRRQTLNRGPRQTDRARALARSRNCSDTLVGSRTHARAFRKNG
jgi:hypothetical protein